MHGGTVNCVVDANDGVEFTTWWLPRITTYLVTRPTSSTRGSKIVAIEPPATSSTVPSLQIAVTPCMRSPACLKRPAVSRRKAESTCPRSFVRHSLDSSVRRPMQSSREGDTPPTEIAVGAHVLVRGPPAYFGCIQVVYAGGTLLDVLGTTRDVRYLMPMDAILDGQHHLHRQVPIRLVEIISIDTQLQEHCTQLTAMVHCDRCSYLTSAH